MSAPIVTPEQNREAFLRHVAIADGNACWSWTGARNPLGYGLVRRRRVARNRFLLAHRLAWEIFVGPIPEDGQVLHKCDNPPCVRPDHLFVGDHFENMRDMRQKGRARNGVLSGFYSNGGRWPDRSGARNSRARLDASDVSELRNLSERGVPTSDLCERFGIRRSQVRRIVRGLSWNIEALQNYRRALPIGSAR